MTQSFGVAPACTGQKSLYALASHAVGRWHVGALQFARRSKVLLSTIRVPAAQFGFGQMALAGVPVARFIQRCR